MYARMRVCVRALEVYGFVAVLRRWCIQEASSANGDIRPQILVSGKWFPAFHLMWDGQPLKGAGELMYPRLVLGYRRSSSVARARLSRVDILRFAARPYRRNAPFHPQEALFHSHGRLWGGSGAALIHRPRSQGGGNHPVLRNSGTGLWRRI